MRGTAIIVSFAFMCVGNAQVRIDAPVQLAGDDPVDKQVTGLAPLNDPAAALSVEAERHAALVHAQAAPGTAWIVDVPALASAPVAGTHLTVSVPDGAAGPVSLLLNGLGPYNVMTGSTTVLDGEQVTSGSVLSLVFTGAAFQLMNGRVRTLRACPEGMAAVNGQFCIDEQQDLAVADFFYAARTCGDRGLRLCSWAEFHTACVNSATLGLSNMVGDWEWIGSACNEDGGARLAGSSTCTTATCVAAIGDTDRNFRCCIER